MPVSRVRSTLGTPRATVARMADKYIMLERASRLIRSYEVAGGDDSDAGLRKGFEHYGRRPEIPDSGKPGNAGLTIGFGHDLGQSTKEEIDWFYGPTDKDGNPQREILTKAQRERLKKYAGKKVFKKGEKQAALKATRDIEMSYEDAAQVFEKHLLVKKALEPARKAYPGFDDLPWQQQAAILDRTYMRGSGPNKSEGKRGKELWMQLHAAIYKRDTEKVYATLKAMEALHKPSKLKSSTAGRARTRADLAKEGVGQPLSQNTAPLSEAGMTDRLNTRGPSMISSMYA